MIKRILKNPLVAGGAVYTGANFFIGFLNYLFNILSSRVLGPIGYGEIATVFSYTIIASIPLGILSSVIIQKIGKSEEQEKYALSLYGWFIEVMRKYQFFLLLPLLIIPFLPRITNLHPVSAYSLVPLIYIALFSVMYDSIFQGLHMLGLASGLLVFATLIKLMGPIVGAGFQGALTVILLFFLFSGVIRLVLSHIVFQRLFSKVETSAQRAKRSIRSLIFDTQLQMTTLNVLAITLLSNVDIVIAKKLLSAESAGVYALWSLFAKIVFYALGPIMNVGFLFFTSIKYRARHTIVFIATVVLLVAAGICGTLVYAFFGEALVQTVFGDKYLPILPYITYAAIFGIGYVLLLFINNYFLAQRNKLVYLLPGMMPVYLGLLFLLGNSISKFININLLFTYGLMFMYLTIYGFAYVKNHRSRSPSGW